MSLHTYVCIYQCIRYITVLCREAQVGHPGPPSPVVTCPAARGSQFISDFQVLHQAPAGRLGNAPNHGDVTDVFQRVNVGNSRNEKWDYSWENMRNIEKSPNWRFFLLGKSSKKQSECSRQPCLMTLFRVAIFVVKMSM